MAKDNFDRDKNANNSEQTYKVYTAGRMFAHHDLAFNAFLKEAVWRFSNKKFELVLPQSNQPPDLDKPDPALRIRNFDLMHVIKSDLLLVIFGGEESDAGAVVEYIFAKFLGKPTVILRSDSRGLNSAAFDDPYNLMAKDWPRNMVVHVDSMSVFSKNFSEGIGENTSELLPDDVIRQEVLAAKAGFESIGQQVADALEVALQMDSPYPDQYQEMVYQAARFAPGSGFEEVLSEIALNEIIDDLQGKGSF